jgi:hypothetical protein
MIISIHTKNRRREKEKGITINFKDDTLGASLATEYIMTMIRLNHIVTIEWNEK